LGRIVAEIDEVTTRVVLSELVELARNNPQLTEGRVMCLARRDEQKGTDYLGTLRAYLDSFGDIGAAAKAINVHPNTLRYRLRRLAEVSGLDLLDPDDRLVAELQLRFLRTPERATGRTTTTEGEA
ncbi:MAG: helix-turn-helix domain-containing protein, partial [Acidimicrobiales bacterium]